MEYNICLDSICGELYLLIKYFSVWDKQIYSCLSIDYKPPQFQYRINKMKICPRIKPLEKLGRPMNLKIMGIKLHPRFQSLMHMALLVIHSFCHPNNMGNFWVLIVTIIDDYEKKWHKTQVTSGSYVQLILLSMSSLCHITTLSIILYARRINTLRLN